MAEAAAAVSVIGGAMGIAGGVMSAVGDAQKGEADATINEYNAKVADQNAETALQNSGEAERRARVHGRQEIGSMRAAYGASGVTLEGSALDVLQNSAANSELDALTIRQAGQAEAAGYKNQAQLDRFRASAARSSGYLSAAGDVATGVARATLKRGA